MQGYSCCPLKETKKARRCHLGSFGKLGEQQKPNGNFNLECSFFQLSLFPESPQTCPGKWIKKKNEKFGLAALLPLNLGLKSLLGKDGYGTCQLRAGSGGTWWTISAICFSMSEGAKQVNNFKNITRPMLLNFWERLQFQSLHVINYNCNGTLRGQHHTLSMVSLSIVKSNWNRLSE